MLLVRAVIADQTSGRSGTPPFDGAGGGPFIFDFLAPIEFGAGERGVPDNRSEFFPHAKAFSTCKHKLVALRIPKCVSSSPARELKGLRGSLFRWLEWFAKEQQGTKEKAGCKEPSFVEAPFLSRGCLCCSGARSFGARTRRSFCRAQGEVLSLNRTLLISFALH